MVAAGVIGGTLVVSTAGVVLLYTPETGEWLARATAHRLALRAARGRR